MGFPPGITSPREDFRLRTTPSSDNPLSGKLFLVETPHGCHICIISNFPIKNGTAYKNSLIDTVISLSNINIYKNKQKGKVTNIAEITYEL